MTIGRERKDGKMKGIASREEQMMQTMKRLFEQRDKDGFRRINGLLPSKQRKYMDSILKQAKAILNEQP